MEPESDAAGQPRPEVEGKLFLGGLPDNCGANELVEHCSQWGEVADCVVMDTKNYGFVVFADPRCAMAFLEHRDHVVGNRRIDVKAAVPKHLGGNTRLTRKLFVGGTRSLRTEEFVEHFAQFGNIEDAVIVHREGVSRGFGFVTFSDEISVEKCLVVSHTIAGKKVELKRAIPKEEMEAAAEQAAAGAGGAAAVGGASPAGASPGRPPGVWGSGGGARGSSGGGGFPAGAPAAAPGAWGPARPVMGGAGPAGAYFVPAPHGFVPGHHGVPHHPGMYGGMPMAYPGPAAAAAAAAARPPAGAGQLPGGGAPEGGYHPAAPQYAMPYYGYHPQAAYAYHPSYGYMPVPYMGYMGGWPAAAAAQGAMAARFAHSPSAEAPAPRGGGGGGGRGPRGPPGGAAQLQQQFGRMQLGREDGGGGGGGAGGGAREPLDERARDQRRGAPANGAAAAAKHAAAAPRGGGAAAAQGAAAPPPRPPPGEQEAGAGRVSNDAGAPAGPMNA